MSMIIAAAGVPEVPNALTFIEKYLKDSQWSTILYNLESLIFTFIVASLIALVFYIGSKDKNLVPSALQNFLEWIVESFSHFVIGVIGPEGERFVPFLGTLFIYILCMNLFGLVPLMKAPSSNLNTTVALALCVFARVQYLNFKNMGARGFLYHLAGSPKNLVGWLLVPLIFPIELLTQISRPVSLALRLFGNILGEKILIAFFATVSITIFYFLPVQLPFMFLGLLTGLMQALVFTLLSTIYIYLSFSHADEHD